MPFWTIALSCCALLQVVQGSSHGLWDFNSGSLIHSPATFLTETQGRLHRLRGNEGREEVNRERDLRRQKRTAASLDASPTEYTIAVEIRFADSSLQNIIKSYLNNLSLPVLINASDPTENISSIQVTTVCKSTNSSSSHCYCEDGYGWPSEACLNPAAPEEHPNSVAQLPSQETYCERLPEDTGEIYRRNMNVRLNIPFQNALRNPSSKMYEKYKRDLECAFIMGYKILPGFISARVKNFRDGSTVVDYEVTSARAIPVEKASGTVAAALNSSYCLEPNTFRTSSVEIYGGTNISISPEPIFRGDTVIMRCESRSKSSNVTWSNMGRSISNSSRHSITSAHADEKSTSELKIRDIFLNDSGEYRCAFTEQGTLSDVVHVAERNITISSIQIMTSEDTVVVCNGEKKELSCCVDSEMSFFNVHWKMNGAINISGTNYSTFNCSQYVLRANETQCPADKSGTNTTYTCELSTADGARQSKHITVKYLREAKVTLVSSTKGQISERDRFSLTCRSDISNYDRVSWEIHHGSLCSDIDSKWYATQKTPNGAESVLNVSEANQNWAGTYTCTFFQEFLGSSVNLSMEVFPLPLQRDIVQDPIEAVVPFPGSQTLRCCIPKRRIENYNVTFTFDNTSSCILKDTRPEDNFCYRGTLWCNNCDSTGQRAFSVSCEFQNKIGGRIQSSPMSLRLAPKKSIRCNSSEIGFGETGAEVVKPCLGNNSSVRGNITYRCAHTWVVARNSCLSVPINDLLLSAESLLDSSAPVQVLPIYLKNLNSTVKAEQKDISNSSANLEAVVGILNKISVIPVDAEKETVANFLSTVDTVISTPTDTWNAVTNGSSQLLGSVEQFSKSLIAVNDTIPSITLENIQLQGAVLHNISDYNKNFTFSSLSNLSSNVLINEMEIKKGNLFQSTIVSVAYSNLSHIIPQQQQSEELINGLVISTVVKANQSEPFQIQMIFAKVNKSLINPRCVFWNFSFYGDQGGWDNTGCESKNNEDSITCSCNHLTSFSVLMSPAGRENHDKSHWRALSYMTYIGLGISILSLVVCLVIEALVWKSVTKTRISYMRHICILNIVISLLIADIWFIVIAAMGDTKEKEICTAAAFFTHFFYLCVFFWMLSLSLMLFYHLVFILHNTSKTTMKAVAFCLGYGCPLAISSITIAVTSPHNYTRKDLCFLNWDNSYALLALVVPALVIVAINAVITIVVLAKIPIRSIGERSRNDERSSLYRITKSFSVLTPLLGLTWGFGLATVFEGSSIVFHILFNFFNAFQGLFVLLFGILWDRKVREALLNKFSVSRWGSQFSKSSSQGHSAPMLSISSPFSRALNNLFGKAGKYQVSSTESASSSSENTSKPYSLLT